MLKAIVLLGAFFMGMGLLLLLICWGLAVPLRWVVGFTEFQSFSLAAAALLILSVFIVAVVVDRACEIPWLSRPLADRDEVIEILEPELKDAGGEVPGEWFKPCPCGSTRPFAGCCGKKAFKKKRA